jgi:carbonic anhydrase
MKGKHFLFILLASSCSLFSEQSGIEKLIAGNKRFVNDQLEHPNRSLERRQGTLQTQTPFAIIVGCSDSRLSPEIIFDQGIGDLFVVRLAGNVVGPLAIESIEFGVLVLRASTLLVLGHEKCGAVDAIIQGQAQAVPELAALIKPAVETAQKQKGKNLLEDAIKANAIGMKRLIMENKDLKPLIDQKKLSVHAGYYHLESGEVEILP